MIAGEEPDVIMLTEVIPKAQIIPISPALLAIPGYTMYTNFDPTSCGLGASGSRGVSIYVSAKLKASEIGLIGSFHEQLWVSISLSNSDKLLIGCIYRSPSGDNYASIANLGDMLREVCSHSPSHLLVVGDFNVPQINWEIQFSTAPDGHFSHLLLEALADCFLFQHVHEPTRYRVGELPSTLDLILSNEEGMIQNLHYLPGLGNSDHITLHFQLACYTTKSENSAPKLNFWRADFTTLNSLICDVMWDELLSSNVEESYATFKDTLVRLSTQCIPKSKNHHRKKNLYMNSEAMNLRKKKRELWSNYTKSQSLVDHARFTRCRNRLRSLTRRLRNEFERDIAGKVKQDPKQFWKYANSRLKTKARIGDLKDEDGNVATENKEKAEILNRYLSSVFTRENLGTVPPPTAYNGPLLDDICVSEEDVRIRLSRLKTSSSPGPDGIHPRILKETASSVSVPLTNIFRRSLQSGTLPPDWKRGTVIPIFKKGDRKLTSNYRPISLTSIPCKVLESVIRDQVMAHLMFTGQLSANQHGFRPKRSCTSQLLEVIEDWTEALEQGKPIDSLYLDFRKAFDSVPHQRLLSKLRSCGITGCAFNWIRAFLTDRQQQVVVGGSESPWSPVSSGVPQGSVLGPLLFLIFINDMPTVVSSTIKMFADDTKVYRPLGSDDDHENLQRDLDAITEWSDIWQLPFNDSKCKVLHVGSYNPEHSYTMRGVPLVKSHVERDLGIQVDTDLKFRKQAASAVAKGSQILSLIRRSFELLDRETLPLLYKTLVRPHLEYGCTIWGPFNRADQKAIERVQRRATKQIAEIRHEPYQERLRQLNLPSLYYRRRRGDMIKVYQIIHSDLDLLPESFFSTARDARTRGHQWKLSKEQAQTRVRRQCFSARVVNDWNALPVAVVTAPTLNQFKAQLDTHWASIRYYIPD